LTAQVQNSSDSIEDKITRLIKEFADIYLDRQVPLAEPFRDNFFAYRYPFLHYLNIELPNINDPLYESYCNIQKLEQKKAESCNKAEIEAVKNYQSSFRSWVGKREERRLFSLKTCKNKDLVSLMDFHFFLTQRYDYYEYCLNNVKELTEDEKIKELKKILFNLIKKIDITEPIIDSKDTSIQELSKEIVSLSILTLTHYSNFDAYYTRFPILDYELLNDFSIVTENTFTHEKLFKLKFRLSYLKNLQKYLTYYTFQRKSKNENELLSENKLLLEMMQEDTKILNMRTEISKEAQNKLDQVNKCFSNINEALLRKISLGYYIGFYEHYSKAYYKSESSSSNSFEVNSLISLYHKYVYTGDIFTRRLKNLDESCLQIQKINPKLLEIDSFLSKYSR